MRGLAALSAAIGLFSFTCLPAQSAIVYSNVNLEIYEGQGSFPSGLSETQVFLDGVTNSPTVTGHVGSQGGTPLVNFTANTGVTANEGFADISAINNQSTYSTLNITVPGYTFGDIIFDTKLANKDPFDLTISVYNGNTLLGTNTWTGDPLKTNANQSWLILALDAVVFTEVVLQSNSGFEAIRHFELSEVTPVPLPATAWLLGSAALIGLGGLGLSRKRRAQSVR